MNRSLLTFLLISGLGSALVAVSGGRAEAQSTSAQAQSLFDEGRRLMKAGKIAEACAAFDSSQKLDPAVTTLLNLATCRETNRQLATAWGQFADANRLARAANNEKLAKVASSHAKKLEPRLSKLTINVAPDRQVAGLVVTRGGDPIDPASFNHALPVDGGAYTITAKAPGKVAWSTTKTIKVEGDAQTVEIPVLVAAPVAPPPPVARTEPAPRPPTVVATASPSTSVVESRSPVGAPPPSRSKVVPIAVGAGALALGGAAIAFHFSGNSQYDKAKQEMADQARRDSLESSANTRRHVAQVLGVAAVATAGVAVFLYVRGRGERRTATALAPMAAPGLAGLAITGGW